MEIEAIYMATCNTNRESWWSLLKGAIIPPSTHIQVPNPFIYFPFHVAIYCMMSVIITRLPSSTKRDKLFPCKSIKSNFPHTCNYMSYTACSELSCFKRIEPMWMDSFTPNINVRRYFICTQVSRVSTDNRSLHFPTSHHKEDDEYWWATYYDDMLASLYWASIGTREGRRLCRTFVGETAVNRFLLIFNAQLSTGVWE